MATRGMDCLADTRCTEIAKDDHMNLTFWGLPRPRGTPILFARIAIAWCPVRRTSIAARSRRYLSRSRTVVERNSSMAPTRAFRLWISGAGSHPKGETSTCSFSIKLIHSTAPVTGSHIRMDHRFGWKSRTREAGMISGKTPINARHLAHHPRKPAGIHA